LRDGGFWLKSFEMLGIQVQTQVDIIFALQKAILSLLVLGLIVLLRVTNISGG